MLIDLSEVYTELMNQSLAEVEIELLMFCFFERKEESV